MDLKLFRGQALALGLLTIGLGGGHGADFNWQVVVNNGVTVPGYSQTFNSYNQPSLNVNGLVVFRARSQGGTSGTVAHGIYTRDMLRMSPVVKIFDRTTQVPHPNNLSSAFVEPPAFPRIDSTSNTVASRGIHPPVWRFALSDGTDTRAGTTGIYTNLFGILTTGASKLGVVPAFPFYAVPGTVGIPFDVFPGAPAVTDGATIVFKGNFTLGGVGRTGVYYRDLLAAPAGGLGYAQLIADTSMYIPGTGTLFGSTAPPSAAGRQTVFTGLDNEDNPTKGGLYMARLSGSRPPLTTLVRIGGAVPGQPGAVFNRLGEGLSFDGRFLAFWGAWGSETKTLRLICREEGRAELVAYCRQQHPAGFVTTVPLRQGIFVYDTVTGSTSAVATSPGDFDDFVYWNFSGLAPGTGDSDEDAEPARWRSASFAAVSGLVDGSLTDGTFHTVFKARKGSLIDGGYVNPVDGLYLNRKPGASAFTTVVATGTDGFLIDPAAIDPLTLGHLPVTEMGIEREGFRGKLLAVNVSMGTEEAGWAGIYMTEVRDIVSPACAIDASTQFNIVRGGYRYDYTTQRFTQTVTITRTASGPLAGPFALAVESLSANATLYGAAGTTTCIAPGSPYVVLNPGANWTTGQTVAVTLQFVNPSRAGITYTPAVLAGSPR